MSSSFTGAKNQDEARTNQAVLGGFPREVADVAAAAFGGGSVAESGTAVAARLGGSALGGRLVLADGDVAVAEGVACC